MCQSAGEKECGHQTGYCSLIKCMIFKYLLPLCGLSFHSHDSVLWCTKIFYFDEVQLSTFFFCCLTFGVISRNSLLSPRSGDFPYILFLGVFKFWIFNPLWVQLHCCVCGNSVLQHCLLQRLSLPCGRVSTALVRLTEMWEFISRLLVVFCWSVGLPFWLYHALDYCIFVVNFDIAKCEFSNFIFFLQLFWLFAIPWNFTWIFFFLRQLSCGILVPWPGIQPGPMTVKTLSQRLDH